MADAWFRFYNTALDDPKVLMLTDGQFRAWVTLLCIASKMDGTIPHNISLIAASLRKSAQKAADTLQVLMSANLIDLIEDSYQPHNWDQRQFKTTNSSERVRKYRARVKQNGGKVGDYLQYRDEILQRDAHTCIYCSADDNLVIDHVVPVISGGPAELWNLVTACKGCNSGKAGRDPFQANLKFREDSYRDFCRSAVTRCNRDRNPPETETKAETERKKMLAPAGRFDEFWLICPKKTGRGAAEKAWPKAVSLADEQTLIDAMRGYAASQAGKDKTFTKTPGPWLNGKHWLDDGIAPAEPVDPEKLAKAKDWADRYYKRGKYAENYT